MGICIDLAIAKSVTKKEWKAVYEETLKLVQAFPLAEIREVRIDGIDTICLARTEEHEEYYGWNDEKVCVGWNAVGDYTYMCTADRCIPEKLLERIQTMPVTEEEKTRIFARLYLGNKDAGFGNYLRESFSEKACNENWKKRFGNFRISQIGFDISRDFLKTRS